MLLKITALLGSFAASYAWGNQISKSPSMTRTSVFVDDSFITLTGDCHTYNTKDACVSNQCYWCKSAAVRSMCYTEAESQQLPPGVFECDKKEKFSRSWALTSLPTDTETWISLFNAWKLEQRKQYQSVIEEEMRRAVFEENARMVAAHNIEKQSTFTMELNQFADTTWEEFQKWYLGQPQNCSATHVSPSTPRHYSTVPESKDWRDMDAVSPVKNQGKCGSCWTFSTTGALESHYKLKHGGEFVLFSEQNLIDCAQAFDNHGCNGGLPSHAFEYVHYNGGLDTEETYPYHGVEEKCKFNNHHVGVNVESSVNITAQNEHELKGAVGTVGPVSVAFQVSSDFRFYKSGVYSSKQCKSGVTDVNHAVLAVGYGTVMNTNQPYWIIKNSWGVTWGMSGYFEIERNSNMCGIADCASYPNVK